MTTFMQRSARHFLMIKAVREIKGEIEKAGRDNLKTLVDAGVSIIGTYLNGCAPEEKARIKRDFDALLQLGVTPEMLLSKVINQMPELAPIIEGKEGYKRNEIQKLEAFLQEG